jgi:hypothetical protein
MFLEFHKSDSSFWNLPVLAECAVDLIEYCKVVCPLPEASDSSFSPIVSPTWNSNCKGPWIFQAHVAQSFPQFSHPLVCSTSSDL